MAAELPLELELELGERALLSLDAGLLLPLTRYQFVFSAPETSIYVTPPVAFTIELGFGVRL